MPDPVAINVTDAARLLGVHKDTLRKLIQRGEVPATRLGGLWLIPRSFVDGVANARVAS